jgi:octaprenyl-diphosphate synthase
MERIKQNTKNLESEVNERLFADVELKENLKRFESFFRECLTSDSPLLNKVLKYVFDRKGKRMRPICVFLSAAATQHPPVEATFVGAAAIEMIHTASLIHDDVVDRSDMRRGNKSVNAEWSPQIAVLTGDYLLAKALRMVTEHELFDFTRIMAKPICEMSEGEMLQIEQSHTQNSDEQTYLDIIRKKTAAFIGTSMEIGAKSTGGDHIARLMYDIGENIGMAFQIKDDVFDYQKTNLLGKPAGNDIIEKKMTLPLIHALRQATPDERKLVLGYMNEAAAKAGNVSRVRDFVVRNHGTDYAMSVAALYVDQAISLISSLDDSPAKLLLMELSRFVTNRRK